MSRLFFLVIRYTQKIVPPMAIITAITAQVKNKDRVNIFLDDQYAFSLAIAAAVGLKVGDTLSDEQIAARQSQDTLEKAKEQVI